MNTHQDEAVPGPLTSGSPFAIERDRRWNEMSQLCLAYERKLADMRSTLRAALDHAAWAERELEMLRG